MEKESKQANPRRFMTDMVAHIKRVCKKEESPCDIDLDYVCDLWSRQRGRCSITGILMSHTNKDLCGVRIDLIDDSKGYTKGNIQLICDGVKRMRKDMPNEEVKRFIQEIKTIVVIN